MGFDSELTVVCGQCKAQVYLNDCKNIVDPSIGWHLECPECGAKFKIKAEPVD